MELEKPREGDSYEGEGDFIPETLKDARKALNKSEMLRQAFGEEVIDHYVRAADWEIEDFHRVVTDYEVKRGFERS
jgi:glutamine synthetase